MKTRSRFLYPGFVLAHNSMKRFPVSDVTTVDDLLFDSAKLRNSERMTCPPIPTSKSATFLIVGLAEIPEKPSEAPHSVPMQSLERERAISAVH